MNEKCAILLAISGGCKEIYAFYKNKGAASAPDAEILKKAGEVGIELVAVVRQQHLARFGHKDRLSWGALAVYRA
jgi:hypothetical protein